MDHQPNKKPRLETADASDSEWGDEIISEDVMKFVEIIESQDSCRRVENNANVATTTTPKRQYDANSRNFQQRSRSFNDPSDGTKNATRSVLQPTTSSRIHNVKRDMFSNDDNDPFDSNFVIPPTLPNPTTFRTPLNVPSWKPSTVTTNANRFVGGFNEQKNASDLNTNNVTDKTRQELEIERLNAEMQTLKRECFTFCGKAKMLELKLKSKDDDLKKAQGKYKEEIAKVEQERQSACKQIELLKIDLNFKSFELNEQSSKNNQNKTVRQHHVEIIESSQTPARATLSKSCTKKISPKTNWPRANDFDKSIKAIVSHDASVQTNDSSSPADPERPFSLPIQRHKEKNCFGANVIVHLISGDTLEKYGYGMLSMLHRITNGISPSFHGIPSGKQNQVLRMFEQATRKINSYKFNSMCQAKALNGLARLLKAETFDETEFRDRMLSFLPAIRVNVWVFVDFVRQFMQRYPFKEQNHAYSPDLFSLDPEAANLLLKALAIDSSIQVTNKVVSSLTVLAKMISFYPDVVAKLESSVTNKKPNGEKSKTKDDKEKVPMSDDVKTKSVNDNKNVKDDSLLASTNGDKDKKGDNTQKARKLELIIRTSFMDDLDTLMKFATGANAYLDGKILQAGLEVLAAIAVVSVPEKAYSLLKPFHEQNYLNTSLANRKLSGVVVLTLRVLIAMAPFLELSVLSPSRHNGFMCLIHQLSTMCQNVKRIYRQTDKTVIVQNMIDLLLVLMKKENLGLLFHHAEEICFVRLLNDLIPLLMDAFAAYETNPSRCLFRLLRSGGILLHCVSVFDRSILTHKKEVWRYYALFVYKFDEHWAKEHERKTHEANIRQGLNALIGNTSTEQKSDEPTPMECS